MRGSGKSILYVSLYQFLVLQLRLAPLWVTDYVVVVEMLDHAPIDCSPLKLLRHKKHNQLH